MIACSLYPPNTQSFSESIIGRVMQRQVTPSCRMVKNRSGAQTEDPATISPKTRANTPKFLKGLLRNKGAKESSKSPNREMTSEEIALYKKLHHRERCRNNQARYRKKQLKIKMGLNEEITKLEHETEDLEARYRSFTRIPNVPTIWTVATEYFRHFNYYVSRPDMLHDVTTEFLRNVAAPDVFFGSASDVEEVLRNWRLFSIYFGDVYVEVKNLAAPLADVLIAATVMCVTITSDTLRYAFPKFNTDGVGGTKGGKWTPIATKLLGQRLTVHGSVHFDWDGVHGQLETIQARADMLTPILCLIGNLEDTSSVFEGAFVTPDCKLVASGRL